MQRDVLAKSVPQRLLIERYRLLIGSRAADRLHRKARALSGLRVLHINSTRNGGGVAEILSGMVPLMNEVGIATDWLVIDGSPKFFELTKDIHNALHGEPLRVGQRAMALHRDVSLQCAESVSFQDYDVIVVHDPQPLWLIDRRGQQKWIWCCHIDLSAPDPAVWSYLAPTADRYDTVVFSLPEYAQPLPVE